MKKKPQLSSPSVLSRMDYKYFNWIAMSWLHVHMDLTISKSWLNNMNDIPGQAENIWNKGTEPFYSELKTVSMDS